MSIYDRGSFQSVLMVALQAIYSTPSPVTGAFLTFLLWYIIKQHLTPILNIRIYDRNKTCIEQHLLLYPKCFGIFSVDWAGPLFGISNGISQIGIPGAELRIWIIVLWGRKGNNVWVITVCVSLF